MPKKNKEINKLRILLVNFQSVKGKSAVVASLADIYNPDIICATETWLNGEISSSEIFPDSTCFLDVTEILLLVVVEYYMPSERI